MKPTDLVNVINRDVTINLYLSDAASDPDDPKSSFIKIHTVCAPTLAPLQNDELIQYSVINTG